MPVETEGFVEPTTAEEEDSPLQKRVVKPRKPVYRVRKLTDSGDDPQLTKFDTVELAHRHVEINYPRGREVYVEHPDGFREHYSADLANQGHPSGGWNELTDEEVE